MNLQKLILLILTIGMFVGCSTQGMATTREDLRYHMVAGDEKIGSYANSIIIETSTELFLVDAQKTISNANRLVAKLKSLNKPLSNIFITHLHPDHLLGGPVIRVAFPKAKLWASPRVAKDIAENGEEYRVLIKNLLEHQGVTGEIPDEIVFPQARFESFELAGNRFEIQEYESGESEFAATLHNVNDGVLITGDLVYNDVHMWMNDNHQKEWIKNLYKLLARTITTVLPGHGEAMNRSVIQKNMNYINYQLQVLNESSTAKEAITKMKAKFPNYKMEFFMEFAITNYFKGK